MASRDTWQPSQTTQQNESPESGEIRFKPFENFQQEVISLFPRHQNINIIQWYEGEQRKHLDWPVAPLVVYKDSGWKSWRELVGEENTNRKEFLTFDTFQADVRNSYRGQRGVERWYREEFKKHPNWPSNPDGIYKYDGWLSWPDLVGKK